MQVDGCLNSNDSPHHPFRLFLSFFLVFLFSFFPWQWDWHVRSLLRWIYGLGFDGCSVLVDGSIATNLLWRDWGGNYTYYMHRSWMI